MHEMADGIDASLCAAGTAKRGGETYLPPDVSSALIAPYREGRPAA